jgi:bacillolysin
MNLQRLALLFPLILLTGCTAEDVDDEATLVRDFVGANDTTLVVTDRSDDQLGMRRVRLVSHVDGLPLDDGDVVAVLDQGHVRSLMGRLPNHDHLAATAVLDAAAATDRARAAMAAALPELSVSADAAPVLVAMEVRGALRPAWRVPLVAESERAYAARELMVDAASGEVLRVRDRLETVAAVGSGVGFAGQRRRLQIDQRSDGSYALRDLTRAHGGLRTYSAGGRSSLPGRLVTSASAKSWDNGGPGAGAAVDAHAFAAITYDYLLSVHERRSIDGDDGPMPVVVHFGHELMNAFWDGRRAVFGDGDGDGPLSAGLDVVAHEIFHGVTQATSGLVYEGESGALNESISDVFGTFVELRAGHGNWTIGEAVAPEPLRDLARPAHMSEYVHLPLDPEHDMGGVHTNSVIPSHAAYLVAQRLGVTKTRAIWYRAATVYLSPRAGFADFARATHAAAEDLYGASSAAVAGVDAAWQAVGVQ